MSTATPSDKPAAQRSRRVPLTRKVVYTLLLVLLLLGLCEAGLRVRAWLKYGSASTGITDDMLVYDRELELRVPRPGYQIKGAQNTVTVNALGFRGPEVSRDKPPHTIRIACVGASTTFCTGVTRDEAAWPHRLQEALHRRHPEVQFEVINAGVPGYTVHEGLKNLSKRVLPLQPDLVIYYEAANQLALDSRNLAKQRGLVAPDEAHVSPVIKTLSEYSLLFDLVYKNAKIALSQRHGPTGRLENLPKELPQGFIEQIDRMNGELKKQGIPLVLSTFVVKFRRDQDRDTQVKNADVAFYYMPWMSINTLLDGVDLYNQAVIDYAHSHRVPVVEECSSIPADAKHFVDCFHLSDDGCALMAERFAQFLDKKQGPLEALLARRQGR
jgi:lysophospholipase L1-like esterase